MLPIEGRGLFRIAAPLNERQVGRDDPVLMPLALVERCIGPASSMLIVPQGGTPYTFP
jgi:hypothetical protein